MKYKIFFLLLLCSLLYYSADFSLGINPLPSEQYKVLFIEETDESDLTAGQVQGMDSILINQKVSENNGLIVNWDKDAITDHITDQWYLDAFAYFKDKAKNKSQEEVLDLLPYVVMSHGNKFREGKVENLDKTLEMLDEIK